MADFNQINQFGSAKPSRSGEGMSCAECEAMLADVIDGTLSPTEQVAFDLHIATCKECGQMLADARRGAALLEMLKTPRPEPASSLLDRIIAQTSGLTETAQAAASFPVSVLGLSPVDNTNSGASDSMEAPVAGIAVVPAAMPSNLLPFRPRSGARFNLQAITRTMVQPRFAMTAAMAFFSIALTMNLTGIHFSEFRASDLKPSNIRHTFYQADASLVRYYDNLRVVYELESRVSDLKQSNESDNPESTKPDTRSGAGKANSGPDNDPKHKQTPKAGSGTSQRRSPLPQQFKLADERFDRHTEHDASIAVLCRIALPGRSNQSKDMLQEGGLV